ncbi:GntR family transcriptional regulator [Undibacterium sp. TJN25]|uniref:GntR family transcriptional regulator n=1 Tax=Undibacterium sp. TJN25 TaxID=3413056 RepID=UPI003BF2E946
MDASHHIEKRSLEVQAADAIRSRIISGDMAAGSRITEIRLSEEMNLSRGTIRSALTRLVGEGLVEQTPYSGWSVVALTARGAWELYTLRSSLETLAARLAAANLKDEDGSRLEAALQKLEAAAGTGKLDTVADADFALHKEIISISGHTRLKQQYQALEHQIRMYIAPSDALLKSADEVVSQHAPLVAAILARDPEKAAAIAAAHNLIEGQALVDHFKHIHPAEASLELSFGNGL